MYVTYLYVTFLWFNVQIFLLKRKIGLFRHFPTSFTLKIFRRIFLQSVSYHSTIRIIFFLLSFAIL